MNRATAAVNSSRTLECPRTYEVPPGGALPFGNRALGACRSFHHHVFDTSLALAVIDHLGLQIPGVEALLPFHIIGTGRGRNVSCASKTNQESEAGSPYVTSGDQRAAPVEWVRYCRPARLATERSCDLIQQCVCHYRECLARILLHQERDAVKRPEGENAPAESGVNVKHEAWMRRTELIAGIVAALVLALAWVISRL